MELQEPKVEVTDTVTPDQQAINEMVEKLAKERAIELTNTAVANRVKDLKEKHEIDKQLAVEEALKKAKMTTEEIEAEEVKELANKYAELESKYNEVLNSGVIKTKLSEAGLPQSDALVKSLLGNMENIDTVVKDLKENFDTELQKRVEDKLKSSTFEIKKDSVDLDKPERKYRNTASKIGIGQ